MAEGSRIFAKTSIDKIIQCPLGEHQLHIPYTLKNCLHSFCIECLEKGAKVKKDGKSGWNCCMCDTFSAEDDVLRNGFIEDLIAVHTKSPGDVTHLCQQCASGDVKAEYRCIDCKFLLCDNCQVAHLKVPVLKSHKIIAVNTDCENYIDKLILCPKHDKPVELNCKVCEEPLCTTCKLTDHDDHKSETVDQALVRLIPTLDSNKSEVELKNSILMTQIEAITRQMKDTKEYYAEQRSKVNENTQKLVQLLQHQNTNISEQLKERELQTLEELKKLRDNLKKKLSKSTNLTNIVDVCTDKAKHASLLSLLQSGLFETLKENSKLKQDNLKLETLKGSFHKSEKDKTDEKVKSLFGRMTIIPQKSEINRNGLIWTDNESICEDFTQLQQFNWKKVLEVNIEAIWLKNITYFQDRIWLPVYNDCTIQSYKTNGDHDCTLSTHGKRIHVLRKLNEDIIAAGIDGLYITDTTLNNWVQLYAGKFADVFIKEELLFALQYTPATVHTFRKQQSDTWEKICSFSIDDKYQINENSTIAISQGNITVTSSKTKCMLTYSKTGQQIGEFNTRDVFHISGVDKQQRIIMVNFQKGHISNVAVTPCDTVDECDIGVTFMRYKSVIFDSDHNMWGLQQYDGRKNQWKLCKYNHVRK